MTKAPFSVEWLSQSSQATQAPHQGPNGGPVAPAPGWLTQLGNAACGSRVTSPAHRTVADASRRGRRSQGGQGLEAWCGSDSRREKGQDAAASAGPAAAGRAWGAAEAGADWESGRSECPSPEGPGGRGSRRLRTAFSVEQISTLESAFKRHKYLGSAERRKLAAKMRLSEVQIKTWFQNRRMKLKRQLQELRPEPFYSPVTCGARPGALPLHCLYPAQHQLLAHLPRQDPVPASVAFSALPASALGSASTCLGQPSGFWPAPCFVGYRDPRAFLLPI